MLRRLSCALVFFAAAGLARAVELDIPVFTGGYGIGFYEESARQFEALRPGLTIRIYGNPRIQDQLRVRIIDGHYPDAACVAYILWPALIRSGKVLDLRPYLAGTNWEGDARWSDTFNPGALDTWRVDGRVGGLPVSYSCWTIFYNRGLFRDHGWTEPATWDEFFSLCAKNRAAGRAPLSLPGTSWLYADAFLRAASHNLMGDGGWQAINGLTPGARLDPRYVRSAALEQSILQHETLRGWEGETASGAELSFLQGRSAMTVSGSWLVNEMAGKFPDGFELGAMNFPVFPDGIADPTTINANSDNFFVFATGDEARERLTIDFLRFLTSRARQEAFVRELNSPGAVRGVPLTAYSERMRQTAQIIARAREAFPMTQQTMQPPAVRQALVDESENLTTGKITPQEFARRLEAAAMDDLARRTDPDRVVYRHLWGGIGLLAGLALVFGWLLWPKARSPVGHAGGLAADPRPDARPPAWPTTERVSARPQDTFNRLRPPVALTFVAPALLLYVALVIAPALVAMAWAFTRWNGIDARAWVGLFNFKWLIFESDIFWLALRHNFFLMVMPALFVVPLALLCATLIHRGVWGAGLFRVVFLFPNMLGGIAAALIWLSVYEPHGGLASSGLSALGRWLHLPGLASLDGYPWLGSDHLYYALIPIYVWMACGFNLILYLAAMEGIDPQLYEAAQLDGASTWRQFFTITLPLIREVIIVSAVFLVIGGLNAFEMVWLLTQQMPSASTHTLATLLVTRMFYDFDIGGATALAVVLFLLVVAGSATVMRCLKREAVEN